MVNVDPYMAYIRILWDNKSGDPSIIEFVLYRSNWICLEQLTDEISAPHGRSWLIAFTFFAGGELTHMLRRTSKFGWKMMETYFTTN